LRQKTITRSRAESADINTTFTNIPYPGNSLAHVSENNFSARQSRATLLAESKIGDVKLTGYYEADFLGAGTTSNNRQTNSYVFRQRQIWGQAAVAGFTFTGGQMWTLATEDRKGIQNRQELLPMMIDPNYVVGFTWARQYGFRVVKDFGGKFSLAASIEGPQATLGGRGFNTLTSTTATGVATTSQNFFINAPGQSGGLFNAFDPTGYTVNKAPDFIIKAAADPGWGHYEVFGILSAFRDRIFPCGVVGTTAGNLPTPATPVVVPCPVDGTTAPSAAGARNSSATGGGGGASLNVPLFTKKVDFGLKGVIGDWYRPIRLRSACRHDIPSGRHGIADSHGARTGSLGVPSYAEVGHLPLCWFRVRLACRLPGLHHHRRHQHSGDPGHHHLGSDSSYQCHRDQAEPDRRLWFALCQQQRVQHGKTPYQPTDPVHRRNLRRGHPRDFGRHHRLLA